MKIREITGSDKLSCLEAFQSNVPKFFTAEEVLQFSKYLDFILSDGNLKSGHDRSRYYVLLRDEQLMGCGGFGYDPIADEATMAWGLIRNDFHRQGWGRQLLMYRLQEIGRLHPAAKILMDTTQHSAPFFERLGFVRTKHTNDFYAKGLHRVDMVYQPASGV